MRNKSTEKGFISNLMASLSSDQLTQPVDDFWSALDVFIHTISYIENALRLLAFKQKQADLILVRVEYFS